MKIFDGLYAFMWDSVFDNNCNTYLIDGPTRVLVDPGHEAHFDHVIKGLESMGLLIDDIDYLICTHGHPDHMESIRRFKNERTRVALHETEWRFLSGGVGQRWGGPVISLAPSSPLLLQEGPLELNHLRLEVFHTPGHSPGSICLYWPEKKALFSGDLMFAEGLGRIDLPGGDAGSIKESILRMKALSPDWLFPGHGEYLSTRAEINQTFFDLETVWFQYI